jgi:hypothetical protein
MLIVAVRGIDLLINGWWNCLPAFLSGVLYAQALAPAGPREPFGEHRVRRRMPRSVPLSSVHR